VAFLAVVAALLSLVVANAEREPTPHEVIAAAPSSGFNTMTPERLLDTRSGIGAPAGPVGEGQTLTVQIAGRGSVPLDAVAVLMNVTVDAPSRGGYLTVFPAGERVPETSNINMPPDKTVPNLVAVRLGGGAVSFYNAFGESQVLADVTAYVRGDAQFVGVTPGRVLDTRSGLGTGAAAPVGPGTAIDLDVLGRYGVPSSGVAAVLLNVTVDQPTAASYVTVWPSGVPMPNASSLNMAPGQTVANLVIATVGAGGRVSFFNERGSTHLLADVMGYIPTSAAYVPMTPTRVMDTRIAQGSNGPIGPGASVALDLRAWFPASTPIVGVVLNMTAAEPSERSFLTVYPGDTALPGTSNLNTVAGEVVANAIVVRPDDRGRVIVRNERGTTHVIADLVGLIPLQASIGPDLDPTAPTTSTPTMSTPSSTTTTTTTTIVPTGDQKCVVGAPGAGGSSDLETGFSPGHGYDLDPSRYVTKGMRDFPELSDLQAAATGCNVIIVHAFSEGGRRAKEWYCSGQTLGGRVIGYILDDPNYLPDEGQPCTPGGGVKIALYGTKMAPGDDRWTIDYFLEGSGYGACMDKTAARLNTPIKVSPRYFHEPYTRPSPPEIANGLDAGGWW
jgi:hypothetical protein